VTTVDYHESGLPTRLTEPDDGTWTSAYDDRGNLVAETDPAGAVTRYGYHPHGGPAMVTDPLGAVTTIACDAAGSPIAVLDAAGARRTAQRDLFGRIVRTVDATGLATTCTWTVEGLLTSRTSPDGGVELWRYDAEGNEIEYVDQLGQVTRTEYAGFDVPIARVDPTGARTSYTYDREMRLVSRSDPGGRAWSYRHDAAGNVLADTDPNGREQHYTYDPAGRLVERIGAGGGVTRLVWDDLDRLVRRITPEAVTTFEYDPMGRLTRTTNPNSDVRLVRDPCGRMLRETCEGRAVSSAYNGRGDRTSRRTPSGAESVWEYGPTARPTALHAAGHRVTFGYDQGGREVFRTLGRLTMTQTWDTGGRLRTRAVTAAPPMPIAPGGPARSRLLLGRSYTYRPDDVLTGIADHTGPYRQIEVDRLGRVPTPPDDLGPPGDPALTDRGRGRPEFDADGRLIARHARTISGGTRTWRYTWSTDDLLLHVSTPDGRQWRYEYDGIGRRISKICTDRDGAAQERTDFAWDGDTLAEQLTADGTATTWDYRPGTAGPLTQTERIARRDVLRSAPPQWVDVTFFAIVTDLVGTPTELVTPDGAVAWAASGTAWGAPTAPPGPGPSCPLRFPGQYHDAETGLHYNLFRYYDPQFARYISPDPAGLRGGPDPHAYVPNPHTWLDPLGLTPYKIAGTDGLIHSFDRHAAQWFGRGVQKSTHLQQWQDLVTKASASGKVFDWSTQGAATTAHLSRIDGKYFVTQFFKDGPRAGELATAFVPNNSQLSAMLRALGIG
jgi:RHS repeat-associated protein